MVVLVTEVVGVFVVSVVRLEEVSVCVAVSDVVVGVVVGVILFVLVLVVVVEAVLLAVRVKVDVLSGRGTGMVAGKDPSDDTCMIKEGTLQGSSIVTAANEPGIKASTPTPIPKEPSSLV